MKKIILFAVCVSALFCGCKSAPEYREAAFKFDFPVPANIRPILYDGADYKGKKTEVFAWLGMPENCKGKVPGIVLVHGGGGSAFLRWVEDWTKRGYAAIAIDTVGHRPLLPWEASKGVRERLANGGPSYPACPRDIDSPADAWTVQALEALRRGHTILRNQPGVDPEKTALYGISWGGYLTCWAAATDPRYKAAVSLYGCGFLKESPRTVAKVVTPNWFDRFDPALVLEDVHCPILFVTQPVDPDYQWESWCRSAFLPKNPTWSVPGLIGHSHTRGLRKEAEVFIDSVLKGTPPLPEMGEITRSGAVVSAEFRAAVLPVTGELWWTCDAKSVPISKRQWKSAPATIKGNTVSGKLPAGAKDWFLNVKDSRGVAATALRPHYK
jgi:dienelactone hydrolase